MIDLASPETYANGIPHDEFRRLRNEDPVAWHEERKGAGFWAVTRHADIVQVLRSPDVFSSHRGGCRLEDLPPAFLAKMRENMMNSDPPHHTKLRKLTNHVFSPRRVVALERRVNRYAQLLVDRIIDRASCDFATEVAGEMPLFVICEILGIPESDRAHLFSLTDRMFGSTSEDREVAMQDSIAAAEEMRAYAADLPMKRGAARSEDLVSDLLEAEIDGRKLTPGEFQAFFVLLFNAGADTTRSALCFGLDLLMQHRDALDRIQSDLSLIPSAIEEVLRFETIVIQFRRTALTETELAGQRIAAGDKVVVFFPSGNRDERVFKDSDRFDITRSPNHHIAFGHGTHFCLGAPLARMEALHLFRELFSRLRDFQPSAPLVCGKSNFVRTVHHQPIAYTYM